MIRQPIAALLLTILAACQAASPNDRGNADLNEAVSDFAADAMLCRVDSEAGSLQDKLDACERLIRRGDPKDAVLVGYNTRASLLRRAGQEAEALNEYNEALEHFPESYVLYSNRGMLFSVQGQLESAERDFRRALELAPADPVVMNNLAWALLQRGDYRAGLVLVNRVLAAQPDLQIGHDTQAHALMGLGQQAAAEEAFLKAVDSQGESLVRRYQVELARKGYDAGRRDGVFDEATRQALRACIRDNCRLLLD